MNASVLVGLASNENAYLITLALLAVSLCKVYLDKYRPVLGHIPTIGHSGRLTSFISVFKLFTHGRQIFKQGYALNPIGLFRVPSLDRWEHVVAGGILVEDLKRAGDDEISFHEEVVERMRFDYTIKSNIEHSLYHLKILRTKTATFGPYCGDLHEECVVAMNDLVQPSDKGDWKNVLLWDTIIKLVGRMGCRVLVGPSLCRNPEYLDLCIGFCWSVMVSGAIINLLPKPLRPIIGPWLSSYEKHKGLALKFLGPVIEERLRMKVEFGSDWEGKPDDLISWLVDEAKGEDATVENLAMRVLFINFAAMHNTSMVMTSILLDLAARPEYIGLLRKEAQEVTESEGWTKNAVAKMYKIDSFMRESVRFSSLSGVSSMRKVVDPKGFKLSNGITLPYGSSVSVISDAVHHDATFYPDPSKFDGFRFYNLGKADTDVGDGAEYHVKHAFASLTSSWLFWGVGRHACPGRFFAAHEIKVTIAYILLHYDIALAGDRRPGNRWVAHFCVPDTKVRLMFRGRDS